MKGYSSREVIKLLTSYGWYLVEVSGDHHQFKHPSTKGKITVPHPNKDLPIRIVKSIFKQAKIDSQ